MGQDLCQGLAGKLCRAQIRLNSMSSQGGFCGLADDRKPAAGQAAEVHPFLHQAAEEEVDPPLAGEHNPGPVQVSPGDGFRDRGADGPLEGAGDHPPAAHQVRQLLLKLRRSGEAHLCPLGAAQVQRRRRTNHNHRRGLDLGLFGPGCNVRQLPHNPGRVGGIAPGEYCCRGGGVLPQGNESLGELPQPAQAHEKHQGSVQLCQLGQVFRQGVRRCVGGDDMNAPAHPPVGHGNPRLQGDRQRRRNAGDHLIADPGGGQGLGLFPAPAEEIGVAPFQAHHLIPLAG